MTESATRWVKYALTRRSEGDSSELDEEINRDAQDRACA